MDKKSEASEVPPPLIELNIELIRYCVTEQQQTLSYIQERKNLIVRLLHFYVMTLAAMLGFLALYVQQSIAIDAAGMLLPYVAAGEIILGLVLVVGASLALTGARSMKGGAMDLKHVIGLRECIDVSFRRASDCIKEDLPSLGDYFVHPSDTKNFSRLHGARTVPLLFHAHIIACLLIQIILAYILFKDGFLATALACALFNVILIFHARAGVAITNELRLARLSGNEITGASVNSTQDTGQNTSWIVRIKRCARWRIVGHCFLAAVAVFLLVVWKNKLPYANFWYEIGAGVSVMVYAAMAIKYEFAGKQEVDSRFEIKIPPTVSSAGSEGAAGVLPKHEEHDKAEQADNIEAMKKNDDVGESLREKDHS